jgi:branched-chain amino acid transport system substrate-binding protein
MRRRTKVLVAASLVMTGLATGCSSSKSDSSGSSGNGGSSKDEIAIGSIVSISGSFPRLTSGAKYGLEAWAAAVNAAGGINGRKVHVYMMDDKGDAATALSQAKTLINTNKVVAIVGEQSQNGSPWIPYVVSKGIPIVGGNTYDVPTMTNPGFFNVGGNLLSTFYGIAALAKAHGPKMGNLFCAESPACASTTALLSGFGKDQGLSVGYSSTVSASAPDYTAQCQGVKNSGASSYSLGMAQQTLQTVVTQCVQQGLKLPVILPDTVDDALTKTPGFDGTQIVSSLIPTFDESIPATQEFHAALKNYAPEVGTDKVSLAEPVMGGYASGKLFEAAVKASGGTEITPDTVKKGLYALKGETLGGLTAPLAFTQGKPAPGNCYFSYEIKDGKYIAPNGIEPTCVDAALLAPVLAALGKK